MRRRRVLHALLAACAGLAARAEAATLPQAMSLAAELRRAVAARKPLVVLVSLEGCPYCESVRRSFLAPLLAQGHAIVQIEMASSLPLVDAQGRASTHEQVVRAFGVRVAPTVLFLGEGGREAAPRLAGMNIPDFYGAYLQERLETAQRAVRGEARP